VQKTKVASQAEFDLACALARDNLASYIQFLYPTYDLGPHLQELTKALMAIESGKIDRLICLMPPRHGKSFTATEFFPAWYLGRHPDRYVISAAYGQLLAEDFGAKVRNNIADPRHQATFKKSVLSADAQARSRFTMTEGGIYFAVGRGSTIVGRGAHLFLIDDPVKSRAEASSEQFREMMKRWFSSIAYTRLMPHNSAIVLIQTLWHEDDLAGWLMREKMADGWHILRMPAIAEEDEAWRKKGDVLWPSTWTLEKLERIKANLPIEDWLSLYQQRSSGEDGTDFKLSWLTEAYEQNRIEPDRAKGLSKYILVDPANARGKRNDYTAMWVVGLNADRNLYVLDMIHDRMDLQERGVALFDLHKKWKPITKVLYEEYALSADISYIKERMNGLNGELPYRFSITPVAGAVKKEHRIKRLEPWFRERRIRMPMEIMGFTSGKRVNLVKSFEEEYRAFPGGVHDDLFDALSRIAEPSINLDYPQTREETVAATMSARRRARNSGGWQAA